MQDVSYFFLRRQRTGRDEGRYSAVGGVSQLFEGMVFPACSIQHAEPEAEASAITPRCCHVCHFLHLLVSDGPSA